MVTILSRHDLLVALKTLARHVLLVLCDHVMVHGRPAIPVLLHALVVAAQA